MAGNIDPENWCVKGAFETAPGVFRIPLDLPAGAVPAVNVYALIDDTGITLIDCGWSAGGRVQAGLREALGSLGFSIRDVTRTLITHAHSDHFTQAVALRREAGAPISIGEHERESLRSYIAGGQPHFGPRVARLLQDGGGDISEQVELHHDSAVSSNYEWPDSWLHDGDLIDAGSRRLEVIHTPGHTRGHVVFLDRVGGLLFSGDHVLSRVSPSVGLEHGHASALTTYLSSLHLLQDLPDAVLLPAHGPTLPSSHQRIAELLDHHERRLVDCLGAVGERPLSARQVAERLRWTRGRKKLSALRTRSQVLAINDTAIHLELLVERGLLERTSHDRTVLYRQALAGESVARQA